MPCEKSLCKINQIRNHTVIGICPKAGKLKTVTSLGLTCSPFLMLLFRIPSGTVRIILCICTIGNDKNLNVLIQSASCPERIPLVTVNLIERLTNGYTSAFQFNMYKRQTVYQYGNIIAIVMLRTIFRANHILIDNLQPVVMDVLLIYECNILGRAVITSQDLDIVLLHLPGLFHDMLIGIGNGIFEEIIPLCIRKLIVIQFL